MAKAFLDTTVFTDALLKPGEVEKATKAALARYDSTELPVYAIKEFKAGPLKTYIWVHNKFVTTKSFELTIKAIHAMALTPRRYTAATALEALKAAAYLTRGLTGPDMVDKYGQPARLDNFLCDRYRYALRARIEMAWRRRRKITTQIAVPLSCYTEVAPYEENGILIYKPIECKPPVECCLAPLLKARSKDLEKLKKVIDKLPSKAENTKRAQALRSIYRTPKQPVTEKICRALGDAFFALFAPDDAVILTTNVKDHEPLANVLGKKVERP